MALEIRQGPRGPQLLWNGKQLHSAYAADREAEAWAEGLALEPGTLVFVAGDPWGLATQALARRGLAAVALLAGPEARPRVASGITAWSPDQGSLEAFLTQCFDRWGPEAVAWHPWPAFERHAPEVSLDWARRFRDHYRTVQGSWLTQSRFGARFWRNALRNALDWERPVSLVPGTRPIVVAASGPTLDDGLEVLARHRHRFDLWALPSSFETLVQRGLVPDAGVATDGGFYAREHLQRLAGTEVPLLAALSSAPDPVLRDHRTQFFGQGLPVESALLGALGGRLEVPSQGTVAVTALQLALGATTGPVFIAGLDLCFRDLRGHTSPHTVDRRLAPEVHRLTPAEGLWMDRRRVQAPVVHEGTRTSPAMVTYALWFRSRAQFARPVVRIAPTALRWSTMVEASWDEAQRAWATGGRPVSWSPVAPWPHRGDRARALGSALDALEGRLRATAPDDPWLVEAARTAVPEALAEDWRRGRRGLLPREAQAALGEFVHHLRADLG